MTLGTLNRKWEKYGLIFTPDGTVEWMKTYAWVPVADHIKNDLYKIFFATRNQNNMSQVGYIVIDLNDPKNILEISKEPVLSLGPLGAFDDSAVIPSCIVSYGNKKYLYYVGWMQGKRVPYYASIGLAISEDGGVHYKKISLAPLLDRNNIDPYFTASLDVLIEKKWRMWYLTNTEWTIVKGEPQPRYHIKYAESDNGIDWRREGIVAIDFQSDKEYAIARPRVIKENGIYRMWYSYRGDTYHIGYAESADGIRWERKDRDAGIDVSKNGWDAAMIEYAFVLNHQGKKHMFYNGNEYGKEGIGYARLEEDF